MALNYLPMGHQLSIFRSHDHAGAGSPRVDRSLVDACAAEIAEARGNIRRRALTYA